MFGFSNCYSKLKYYDDSNAWVVGKWKIKWVASLWKNFFGLKPKMYSILVSNSNEYKKAKGLNKNVKISHNKYKDVLLNKNA